jgi:hypothetical protein
MRPLTPHKPVWPGRLQGGRGPPAYGSSPVELPGRFSGGARLPGPTRLSLHGRPSPLTRHFCAWPHPAFLCIPKHRRAAGVYTLSWAGGIAQKLIAMCEHWLAAAGNCKCKPVLSAANASRKEHQLDTSLWCCRERRTSKRRRNNSAQNAVPLLEPTYMDTSGRTSNARSNGTTETALSPGPAPPV